MFIKFTVVDGWTGYNVCVESSYPDQNQVTSHQCSNQSKYAAHHICDPSMSPPAHVSMEAATIHKSEEQFLLILVIRTIVLSWIQAYQKNQ